jgi:hypothetical protein
MKTRLSTNVTIGFSSPTVMSTPLLSLSSLIQCIIWIIHWKSIYLCTGWSGVYRRNRPRIRNDGCQVDWCRRNWVRKGSWRIRQCRRKWRPKAGNRCGRNTGRPGIPRCWHNRNSLCRRWQHPPEPKTQKKYLSIRIPARYNGVKKKRKLSSGGHI